MTVFTMIESDILYLQKVVIIIVRVDSYLHN